MKMEKFLNMGLDGADYTIGRGPGHAGRDFAALNLGYNVILEVRAEFGAPQDDGAVCRTP
jgi:hypothetical protein